LVKLQYTKKDEQEEGKQMHFSKRFYFLAILLICVNGFNCSHIFGMQEQEEKFQILRLSADEKIYGSEEAILPVLTEYDKLYDVEMLTWHQATTQDLRSLDTKVNDNPKKNGYRNLCSLHISVVYNIDGLRKKRDYAFESSIFLSGSNLSNVKPQELDIGNVMLNSNPFTVTLKPQHQQSLRDIPQETLQDFLPLQHNLSLSLKKQFISLDDFYQPSSLEYEKHIIEYFQFTSIVNEEGKEKIKRAFTRSFKSKLQQNLFLNVNPIIEQSINSLDTALLVLPFHPNSNEKAYNYFKETADDLFQKFKYNFCDSEQAIRLFIDHKGGSNLLGKTLGFDETESPLNVKCIEQIYINIASIRYMCPICQGTYLYDIKEKRSIERSIIRTILGAQRQNPKPIMESLSSVRPRVVVYVSGIKETVKDKQ